MGIVDMDKVKIGVVGLGKIGIQHLKSISEMENMELAAICDGDKETADKHGVEYNATSFYDVYEMINSGIINAILIATPHYSHTPITVAAFEAGLHVLCEKPIAVHKADAEEMLKVHAKHPELIFSAMFLMRAADVYSKVKKLLESGELGRIYRMNWTITDWYRTQTYYNAGGWRATWKGEGGGVLINQCPHQFDLLQWFFGMPSKVRAFCSMGKYHDIEVEDDVTAYFEFPNGATGVFVTSTGEAPGTNRLEIAAERGKVVVEDGKIYFKKTEVSVDKYTKNSKALFIGPECWDINIPCDADSGKHQDIIENFRDAIINNIPLIAPGEDGINSIELANAILYSSLKERTVKLPMDSGDFPRLLQELIDNS